MENTETHITRNELPDEGMKKTLWFIAKWGGVFLVYVEFLRSDAGFPTAYIAALVVTLVVQRNHLSSSNLFSDKHESGTPMKKNFLEVSVGEAVSAIVIYGIMLYFVLSFSLPMTCVVQSWFGGTYLSKSLCKDASEIHYPDPYQ